MSSSLRAIWWRGVMLLPACWSSLSCVRLLSSSIDQRRPPHSGNSHNEQNLRSISRWRFNRATTVVWWSHYAIVFALERCWTASKQCIKKMQLHIGSCDVRYSINYRLVNLSRVNIDELHFSAFGLPSPRAILYPSIHFFINRSTQKLRNRFFFKIRWKVAHGPP